MSTTYGSEIQEEDSQLDAKALIVICSLCPISVKGVIRGLRLGLRWA
jgi:hypothetical protein